MALALNPSKTKKLLRSGAVSAGILFALLFLLGLWQAVVGAATRAGWISVGFGWYLVYVSPLVAQLALILPMKGIWSRVLTALPGVSRITEPAPLALFNRIFCERAGLPKAPKAFWLESRRWGSINALVLGDRLLISRVLYEELDEKEFEAVLLHEAAHVSLDHSRERLALVFAMIPFVWLPWAPVLIHFGLPRLNMDLGKVLGFLISGVFLRALIRRHELEADRWITSRGGDAASLSNALLALTVWNRENPARRTSFWWLNPAAGHPTCNERLAALKLGPFDSKSFERFRFRPAHSFALWSLVFTAIAPLTIQKVGLPHMAFVYAKRDDLAGLSMVKAQGFDLNLGDPLNLGKTAFEAVSNRNSIFTQEWLRSQRFESASLVSESGRHPAAEGAR